MELKNLINKMNNEEISLDPQEIKIENLLIDRKYNILNTFLKEKGIVTTNDLKKMNVSDYNKLKMNVPDIEGVGVEKTNLFIKVLDGLRKDNHTYNVSVLNDVYPKVENLGKIKTSPNWSIEINSIKYNQYDEYIDIRQVKNDGTRGKGISIKKQDFNNFKEIISLINLDKTDETIDTKKVIHKNDSELCVDVFSSYTTTVEDNKINNEANIQSLDNMFFSKIDEKSLKEEILENEDVLYEHFKDDFGLAIKYFKAKIECLREDGDIVRFLENPSILDIKKDQYDKIHNMGLKTAIDIKNNYDRKKLKYTTINDLKKNEKTNSMMICSIVNNFNVMLGMYYDEKNKLLILKSQIKDGPYEDKWIETDKKLYYCLQNETQENFTKLKFSKIPNNVCKNIILGHDLETKVYLFYRYNKGDDYKFAGEVSLEKFTDDNKAIIVNIKDDKQNKSDGWKQDVLKCVNKIEKVEFSLDDVYAFEVELQIMHPDNYHIRDKIRQQLQYIRADGIIEFLGNGKYKKL